MDILAQEGNYVIKITNYDLSQYNLNISIFQYFPHFNIYLPESIREK